MTLQGTSRRATNRSFRERSRVAITVPFHRLTRRQALKLGAATAALGALRPAPSALAVPKPEAFTLALAAPGTAGAASAGWRTTPVYDAPRRFDLIGLGWRRGSGADAQVRARRRGGRWSRWTHLHEAGDHGPDAGRGAAGTDPAWTGAADQFQLRIKGSPRGLHARFVRSGPAARAARDRMPLAHASRRQVPGAPVLFTRSQWGGDAVVPRAAPSYGQVQLAFVHHTVNTNDYGPEDSAAIVLGIAKYHRDHNGWNDLGYNFLVDQYGQIFEGRAGGIDLPIVGAQAQGFNSVSTGVACIGTYTSVAQTEAGDGSARAHRRLEALPPRHPRRRRGDRHVGGRRVEQVPLRDARHVPAHLRPPRRQRDVVPRQRPLHAAGRPAHARRALRDGRRRRDDARGVDQAARDRRRRC